MSTVIETYGKYETYLKSVRRIKPATLRKVNLSLTYFSELYGTTETINLNATDMHVFFHRLKAKQSRKAKDGEKRQLWSAHLHKILTHIKAYTKWLSDNAMLQNLVPADVPSCKVNEHSIAYLTKQELSSILKQLEQDVIDANESWNDRAIYAAYLWRAVVRMLYTAWLRNFELRWLTYEQLNIPELYGSIIWKGNKPGIITFSETAAQKLNEYLVIREKFFPDVAFRYIFTLYEKSGATKLTEQKLNIALKNIATNAWIQQNVYAHLFRHSLATHLLADGRSIVDVKQKLRHSNITITSIYVHSNPEVVKKKSQYLWDDLLQITDGASLQTWEIFLTMHSLLLNLLSQHKIIKSW